MIAAVWARLLLLGIVALPSLLFLTAAGFLLFLLFD
jgi:hypothetical protein